MMKKHAEMLPPGVGVQGISILNRAPIGLHVKMTKFKRSLLSNLRQELNVEYMDVKIIIWVLHHGIENLVFTISIFVKINLNGPTSDFAHFSPGCTQQSGAGNDAIINICIPPPYTNQCLQCKQ